MNSSYKHNDSVLLCLCNYNLANYSYFFCSNDIDIVVLPQLLILFFFKRIINVRWCNVKGFDPNFHFSGRNYDNTSQLLKKVINFRLTWSENGNMIGFVIILLKITLITSLPNNRLEGFNVKIESHTCISHYILALDA